MWNRMTGPYAMRIGAWWRNIVAPNLLWFREDRSSPVFLFIMSIVVLIGMWLERYVLSRSLAQDNLVSSWGCSIPQD